MEITPAILHHAVQVVHQTSEFLLLLVEVAKYVGDLTNHASPHEAGEEKDQDANDSLQNVHRSNISIANGSHGINRKVHCSNVNFPDRILRLYLNIHLRFLKCVHPTRLITVNE